MFLAADASRDNFVDLDVPPWAWIALGAVLAVMLAIDLFRHRDDHEPSPGEAAKETLAWISCGLAFGGVIAAAFGGQAFGEYISGYLIEKSLSVDNVFVWSIIFTSMAIPLKFQHRVLFWGIFGALTLRLVFILVGSALISRFFWLLVVFGVFLIYTGFKIIRHRDDEGEGAKTAGLGLLRKIMPVTDEFDGHKFFTRREPEAGRDAAVRRARRRRGHRRDLRPRLGARRARRLQRAVHRVRRQRVRHPRPPGDVLPAGQRPAAVPLPVARARWRSWSSSASRWRSATGTT